LLDEIEARKVYKLSDDAYSQVTPLFGDLEVDRLVVQLVLNGTYPGRIFVNCQNEPTAALIAADTCYLGGNERDTVFVENLKKLLTTEIVPAAKGKPLFIFSTTD
jgi:hypothetical protein